MSYILIKWVKFMSKIWGAMLCISIIIAVFFGNPDSVISSIMDSGKSAVENVITLIGMMCFWSGIFNIFEKTSVIKKLSKVFSKTVGFLFSKDNLSDASKEYMCMNITTNIIGVGNAATVNGIKAIKSLHEDNNKKDIPSNNMTTFVLLNTASLQLIPSSMIALRAMYGSSNPTSIVIPVWIVTGLSLIAGIISIKILNKRMIRIVIAARKRL